MYPLLRLTAVMVVLASVPVLADDERDCFQQPDPQLRIKGCSQMIQRDPADAAAYHNRAVAYGSLGDLDHAIADYTKTVEIKPDNAGAYESRGRAYASKGDYTHAIADALKASELTPKATVRSAAITPKPPKTNVVAQGPEKAAAVTKTPKTNVTTSPKASATNHVAKEAPDGAWSGWADLLRNKD